MIEKLNQFDEPTRKEMEDKLNELIDWANNLQKILEDKSIKDLEILMNNNQQINDRFKKLEDKLTN